MPRGIFSDGGLLGATQNLTPITIGVALVAPASVGFKEHTDQVAPEVVVEPSEVELPEVPPVVHVAEVVDVGGGAHGVDDALPAGPHVDPRAEEARQLGQAQAQEPPDVEGGEQAQGAGQQPGRQGGRRGGVGGGRRHRREEDGEGGGWN